MGKVIMFLSFLFFLINVKLAAQLHLQPKIDSLAHTISIKVLPQNFYNQHLSFVCRTEVQLQKLINLPVYIRLGSKEYVDYLEKKSNNFFAGNKPK